MGDLQDLLTNSFGLEQFLPGQEQVIETLLAGRSALAVFPTGGGKSLCYQLPALLLDGLTLVVSPLIALMKDQVDALRARGIAAARLDSSLPGAEARELYRAIGEGEVRLLYVAPERLTNEGFVHRLRRIQIALLAIDEAHCISEWGHNFRPDYLKLAEFAVEHNVGRVLALTATATPSVSNDVRKAFEITEGDHVQTGFRRPNLALHVTPCTAAARVGLLRERLQAQGGGATVVYVTLQKTAEFVAEALCAAGVSARAYHAGLKSDLRDEVQDAFMADRCQVVVATIAFGMGIDKSDIRAVYHFNLPKSLENYAQEIGRAGRDGAPSRCEVFACGDDTVVLGNFSYGDTPTAEAISGVVDEMLNEGPRFSISRYHLGRRHDMRPLVLSTLLTYLELEHYVRATGPFYSGYKFKFLHPERDVLAPFDADRQGFLKSVFDDATAGRIWRTLEPEDTAARLEQPRDRIVKALQYLEETQKIELKPSGLRHGYVRGKTPVHRPDLVARLCERFAEREGRDAERMRLVVDLCEAPGCLTQRLLAYFGEALDAGCGTCGRCLDGGGAATPLPRSAPPPLGSAEADAIRSLHAEGHDSLSSPRQLTRFLCGLASPATTKARLRKHAAFACQGDAAFPQVLEFVERTLGR